jgi:hypothetical protein
MLAIRLLPRPTLPANPSHVTFAVSLAVALAIACGVCRTGGLVPLLIVDVLARRRLLSPVTMVLALALAATAGLHASGNWYAAHRVVPVVGGLAALGVAFLTAPPALAAFVARLSDRRFAFGCVALPVYLALCFSNADLCSGDTKPVVPTAVQMLRHGNRDLAAWNGDGRWRSFGGGEHPYFLRRSGQRPGLYSAYPAGMELFALPAAAAIVIPGLDATPSRINTAERISSRLLTAGNLALFFLLASHFTTRFTAWTATLLLATASPFASTTPNELWQQGGVAFWMLVVLLCEAKGRGRWLQAFACAAMLACRPSAATFLVPFGIWLVMQDWRRALSLTARAILLFLPWAILYWRHYGTPFGPSMTMLNDDWYPAKHLAGVLASPGRGVLVYQPWLLLLAIPSRFAGSRMLLGVLLLHTLLIASWPIWWGGHCWGSRLMTEAVLVGALLILPALEWLLSKRWGGWLVAGFVLLGLAAHLPATFGTALAWNAVPEAVDVRTERLGDWRDPPMLFQFLH